MVVAPELGKLEICKIKFPQIALHGK